MQMYRDSCAVVFTLQCSAVLTWRQWPTLSSVVMTTRPLSSALRHLWRQFSRALMAAGRDTSATVQLPP